MQGEITGPNFQIANFEGIDPVSCPCGSTRRAFMNEDNETASVHIVEIKEDSEVHYHKRMTEIYFVLEGEGEIQLDGQSYPLTPGMSVMIKPGCRHRAVGANLRILNMVVPKFNPEDEWFD